MLVQVFFDRHNESTPITVQVVRLKISRDLDPSVTSLPYCLRGRTRNCASNGSVFCLCWQYHVMFRPLGNSLGLYYYVHEQT